MTYTIDIPVKIGDTIYLGYRKNEVMEAPQPATVYSVTAYFKKDGRTEYSLDCLYDEARVSDTNSKYNNSRGTRVYSIDMGKKRKKGVKIWWPTKEEADRAYSSDERAVKERAIKLEMKKLRAQLKELQKELGE